MSERDEAQIGVDGVIEWRDAEGEPHRVGGLARVFPSGREEWLRHGRLHRTDGPAVIHANGSVKYYVDVCARSAAPASPRWSRRGRPARPVRGARAGARAAAPDPAAARDLGG
jgi:hypothetical protein